MSAAAPPAPRLPENRMFAQTVTEHLIEMVRLRDTSNVERPLHYASVKSDIFTAANK